MPERVNGAPRARTAGLVAERMPEQTLVYDAARGEIHCLNREAALVWDACDGLTPVPEIRDRLASDSGLSLAGDTVQDALDELGAKGLLEAPAHPVGDGLSRRTLLLGAGALAAITTLVIPGFSAAQVGPTLPPTTTPPTTNPPTTTPHPTTQPPTTQPPTAPPPSTPPPTTQPPTTQPPTTPPPTTTPPCRRPREYPPG